ncbi:hypothetical protein Acid345_3515 [Candidatus Koribacter versatilis Ellin345]|uniref:Metallo-beta-lactamase domain-containing protein n=1 Tax=Koribacter versatilis (strain Ellin345) TaxID=204669 RepID=Q1IKT4_KORVE|nr:MBL fold metallo-hydrolase [Candidatus Koribacter versatilis]ABF42516.1 hypothetical protein Acid345_3515 [Candidatus Koribacter versatilis Ellin345]
MHVTWVNHASFVVSAANVSIMSDPWLEGTAFDDGWGLLSATKFGYEEFRDITHIFITHEHPDHFSPKSLRGIAPEHRARITVLYHKTRDRRVLQYCASLGFKTQELPEEEWFALAPGFEVFCGRTGLIDSWLAYRADGKVILNLNDCIYTTKAKLLPIRERLGKPDALFTQFSYADWAGNPEDEERHKQHAQRKLAQMKMQCEVFEPRVVVPCASFVWFCHKENYFMNAHANRIGDVHRFCTEDVKCASVVLYPGDQWEVVTEHDSESAIRKYNEDYASLPSRPLVSSPEIPIEKLKDAYRNYIRKARAKNTPKLLELIPASVVFLSDLGKKVRISMKHGIEVLAEGDATPADISLGSESLHYCYLFDWGGATLGVNGRYTVPPQGRPRRFFWNFQVQSYNASGVRFDMKMVSIIAARKILSKFGVPVLETLDV